MDNKTPNNDSIGEDMDKKTSDSQNTPAKAEKPIYSDDNIVMMMAANEAMRQSVVINVPYGVYASIWDDQWNPGKRSKGDHLSLYPEIITTGMTTLQVVSCKVGIKELEGLLSDSKQADKAIKVLNGLRGFLRKTVVCIAKDKDPDAFAEHWKDGIPCEVVCNLTPDQELFIAMDHDTVSRSKQAIVEQVVLMFKKGRTVRDVTLKVFDELSTHFTALSGEQRKKITDAPSNADKIKVMLKIRRGVMQNLSYLAIKLPNYCLTAYIRSLTSETGDRIKLGDAVALNTANKGGTKASPTKKFGELYASVVESFGKAKAGPKPLNTKQRAEFFGMYGNPLFELIRMHIEGEANLVFDDEDCMLIDLIESGDFTSSQFKVAAESVQKRLDKANAENATA